MIECCFFQAKGTEIILTKKEFHQKAMKRQEKHTNTTKKIQ